MKTAKILSIALLLLSISMVGVSALSTAVPTPVAVELTNDPIVHRSSQILRQKANVQVVKYGSLEYSLLIHRVVAPVVWISHGSEKGLLINDRPQPWYTVKDLVHRTIGKDILLTCDSSSFIRQNPAEKSEVLTFNGLIDADIGAFAVSYLLAPHEQTFNQLIQRMVTTYINPSEIAPLHLVNDGASTSSYIYCHLSQTEWIAHLIGGTITFIFILFNWLAPQPIAEETAASFSVSETTGLLASIVDLGKKLISATAFLGRILGFIWSIVYKLKVIIDSMSLEEKILWGLSLILSISATIALYIASGTLAFWGKLLISIAQILAWALPFYSDIVDYDTYLG